MESQADLNHKNDVIEVSKIQAKNPFSGVKDTVSWYLSEIQRFPTLDHVTSLSLFEKFNNEKDTKAKSILKKKLTNSNLRLVISIAKLYKKTEIPMEDLIQEGNVGLIKAVERYDYRKGWRFSTYATWWIRQQIGQHVLKRRKTIRLPAHAAGIQRKMISAAEEYRAEFGSEPSAEELSELLGTSERIIKATMQSGRQTISLSTPLSSDDAHGDTISDTLADYSLGSNPFEAVAESELIAVTRQVLLGLNPKEAAILRLRFGISEDITNSQDFPVTQEELDAIINSGTGLQNKE